MFIHDSLKPHGAFLQKHLFYSLIKYSAPRLHATSTMTFLVPDLIPRLFQISLRYTVHSCCLLSWEFVTEITGVHKIARF